MMKLFFGCSISVALAVFVTLASGCMSHPDSERTGAPFNTSANPDTGIRYNNVSFLDRNLNKQIAVLKTNWGRNSVGRIEAWAHFRNRTEYPYQLEVRTMFIARDGGLLDHSGWQRIFIPPHGVQQYKESSIGTDISSYYIEVRLGS